MIEVLHRTTRVVLLTVDTASFSGHNLSGAQLADADLAGLDLGYVCLRSALLQRSRLTGTRLNNAILDSAMLDRAQAQQADFTSASLLAARLSNADLQGAIFRYAQMAGAEVTAANLSGANLGLADLRANFRESNFTGADLRGANLAGANLSGANLTNADLTSANLAGANLRGARIQGAKLPQGLDGISRAVIAAPNIERGSLSRRRWSGTSNAAYSVRVKCPLCGNENRVPVDPEMRQFQCRACRKTFTVDAYGNAIDRAARPSVSTPDAAGAEGLDRWRNRLRVRYLGGARSEDGRVPSGTEGKVLEFQAPAGPEFWRVQFAGLGVFSVHRSALEVLDGAFLEETTTADDSELANQVGSTKEAVVYSSKGRFKSLVLWYRDGRHESVDDRNQAERLIRACHERRIPVSKDEWYS